MAGGHPAVAGARQAAAVAKLNGGDGLIDRAAGAIWTIKKLMVMIAHRVGIISNSRRIRYAPIVIP
jgi:hypothetical protein